MSPKRKKNNIRFRLGESIEYKENEEDEWKVAKLESRAGKAKGKYSDEWNIVLPDGDRKTIDFGRLENVRNILEKETNDEIFVSELDMRNYEDEVRKAKTKEMESWVKRQVYEEVPNLGQKLVST